MLSFSERRCRTHRLSRWQEILRARDGLQKTPFVLCTNNHDPLFQQECRERGLFNLVMVLPFERSLLDDAMLSLNLFDRHATALSPVDSIPEQSILDFMRFIGEKRASETVPLYESYLPQGYCDWRLYVFVQAGCYFFYTFWTYLTLLVSICDSERRHHAPVVISGR